MNSSIDRIIVDCNIGIIRYLDAGGNDVLPYEPKPEPEPESVPPAEP